MKSCAVEAVLQASPYQGRLVPAPSQTLKLQEEQDFAAIHAMVASNRDMPRLTFDQFYELLSGVVLAVKQVVKSRSSMLLINSRMPGVIRLPDVLLAADVFMVADLEPEHERLRTTGIEHVVLEQGLVRHSLESGNGRLSIRWFYREAEAEPVDAAASCAELTAKLRKWNFVPVDELPQSSST